MADARQTEKAREVFNTLHGFLDHVDFTFTIVDDDPEDDGKMVLRFTMNGDDLPMEFIFIVDADKELISVYSPMSFKVPDDKRMDMALAICVGSRGLPDGSFDYNIMKGTIAFRQTVSIRGDGEIGEALFYYLLKMGGDIVDRYNDRFFAIAKGMMSVEDFIAAE